MLKEKVMRTIKIAFVDFWKDFDEKDNPFINILKKHYFIEIDKKCPDYVFCSHFGTDYLKYDCVRILYLGEAKAPDFNIYDYAIAFDNIIFGDRYLQYPYLFFRDSFKNAMNKHTKSNEYYLSKKKFCNVVVSNNLCDSKRDLYFKALCNYKMVDSAGRHLNNMPDNKPVKDKLEFQKDYKFSFAFENSSFPDYVTEKIFDAFAADTIPIYCGAENIEEYVNPNSFVNCNGMKSEYELITKIKEIDEDDAKYLEMMKAPVLLENSRLLDMMKESYLEDFLLNIFEQNIEKAKRRNSAYTMWGRNYEHHFLRWAEMEKKWWFIKLRDVARKIRK